MSTVGFVAAVEQIGRADQSVAAAWQAHVTIGSLPLLLFGTDGQRERWLRPLAEGRVLGAFGLTEPDAGSDARGHPHPGRTARRWMVAQRAQGVHLQRRDGHVVRGDVVRAYRAHRTTGASLRQLCRGKRYRGFTMGPRCGASDGVASIRGPCTSTTYGFPTTT